MSPKKPRKPWGDRKVRRKGAVTNREWLVLSEAVFDREDRRCLLCRKIKPLTAHHVTPRAFGGRDEMGNLVALCGGPQGCHERIQKRWRDYELVFTSYTARLRPRDGAGEAP